MTDFSPLDSALHESTPEKIAASLRYLRKADAVMAALMPLSANPQAPPAADYVGDAGPATDDDFVDLPAAVPAGYVLVHVDRMLAACLPGGSSCDPQRVADAIREYVAAQAPPAAAVPAANVTPMRQPRLDLSRLVDAIDAAIYEHGKGLTVTECIGALELAKLELFKEQEK